MNIRKRLIVTDRDIQAYIDGQIEPDTDQARAVEEYLAANPETQARARAYRAQDEMIRARYRDVLTEPVPERLRPESLHAARGSTPLRAAAGLAVVCGAALIGWLVGQPPDRPLERFADRTTTYLAQEEPREPSVLAGTLESLSAMGGTPDFSREGLKLVGARQMDNGDMYEARYRDNTGRELRLFVAPDPQRHNNLLSRTEADGREVVYWQQGPLMYALTGDFSKRNLDEFAHTAIGRIGHGLDTGQLARTGSRSTPSSNNDELTAAGGIDSSRPMRLDGLQSGHSRLQDDALNLQIAPDSQSPSTSNFQ